MIAHASLGVHLYTSRRVMIKLPAKVFATIIGLYDNASDLNVALHNGYSSQIV